jgi:uncharacterized protein YndB with AHSA1/START domain
MLKEQPSHSPKKAEQRLVVTRKFRAPRQLVWNAWSEPKHFMRWWGPKGFTSPSCVIDFRVGGKYLYCMSSPNGMTMWNTGIYKEIIPIEKMTFTHALSDEKGNIVTATYYQMPDNGADPEMLVILTFKEQNGETEMMLTQIGYGDGNIFGYAEMGWNQAFDKLADSLSK